MPELASFGCGVLTGFFVSLFGMQINLVALHRGIDRGRHAAFFVSIGAALADLVFALLALASANFLLTQLHIARAMKWMGVAILFGVGGRILLQGPPVEKERKRNPATNLLLGFLIVFFNPSLVVVWIGIVTFLHTHFPGARILDFRWIFLGGLLIGASVWALILSLIILHKARKLEEARLQMISRISALALLAGGILLMAHEF